MDVEGAATNEAAAQMAIDQATGAAMQNPQAAVLGLAAGMLSPHPAAIYKLN